MDREVGIVLTNNLKSFLDIGNQHYGQLHWPPLMINIRLNGKKKKKKVKIRYM